MLVTLLPLQADAVPPATQHTTLYEQPRASQQLRKDVVQTPKLVQHYESTSPARELEAVEPVEELAELTMLALLLLLTPLTPPVLALLWLLLFQPSRVLLARCRGPCSRM